MYPDYSFYKDVYKGGEDEEIIMPFIREGTDILCSLVLKNGLDETEQNALFSAACAQAEYAVKKSDGFSSARLGDFSYKVSSAETGDFKKLIAPRAAAILEKAGLLFRGEVICR